MTENEKKIFLEWEFFLRSLTDFVQIAKINGIKFEVRTNEQSGHHRPHLHVSTFSASLSVAIDDGEILACTERYLPHRKRWQKNGWKRTGV